MRNMVLGKNENERTCDLFYTSNLKTLITSKGVTKHCTQTLGEIDLLLFHY